MSQCGDQGGPGLSSGSEHAPGGTGGFSRENLALAFGALGVVYGDIGTSPLYALRECFHAEHALAMSPENVLGVLSLIFWSLVFVVSIKYLVFVVEADNRGEGGILALMALALPKARPEWKIEAPLMVALGLFGSALLYGDGIITPAISVLSAVEGLEIAAPVLKPYVIPITLVILVGLFMFQSKGTEGVGKVFSPIISVWFLTLAGLGVVAIAGNPAVLAAASPGYAVDFFARNGLHGVLVLGAVYLVVTGGEALYADMGHFGRYPIRLAWFAGALPALVLNYFGQGALLLADPTAIENPFFRMAPKALLYPVIALATMATVIASQAVISGAFSLTRQAVQLGYCPRVEIIHTSKDHAGQIYIPSVNTALMLATLALVLGFRTSSNLSAAYGIAVSTTMVITTMLAYVVMRRVWGWSFPLAFGLCSSFLVVDFAFFGANIVKLMQGGWVPLAIGAAIFLLMDTWNAGRKLLRQRLQSLGGSEDELLQRIEEERIHRVPGTLVAMSAFPRGIPVPLLQNLRHNHVLHERIVLMTLRIDEERAHVPADERVEIREVGKGIQRVVASYGFMDDPKMVDAVVRAAEKGLAIDMAAATFVVGRESIFATPVPGMAIWRERLFSRIARNATRASDFFQVPRDRVLEIGTQIDM